MSTEAAVGAISAQAAIGIFGSRTSVVTLIVRRITATVLAGWIGIGRAVAVCCAAAAAAAAATAAAVRARGTAKALSKQQPGHGIAQGHDDARPESPARPWIVPALLSSLCCPVSANSAEISKACKCTGTTGTGTDNYYRSVLSIFIPVTALGCMLVRTWACEYSLFTAVVARHRPGCADTETDKMSCSDR